LRPFLSNTTRAIANAITASLPGLAAIHSSAFAPVSETCGPTFTKRPRWCVASLAACMSANSRFCRTGLCHVSRKSLPKFTSSVARAIRYWGTSERPKVFSAAARRAWYPSGSSTILGAAPAAASHWSISLPRVPPALLVMKTMPFLSDTPRTASANAFSAALHSRLSQVSPLRRCAARMRAGL
jgi:hypothetical protein